jgi:hypothetical protein
VLHPYYKLAYIKMAWGGPEEQAKERAAGNRNAKDWHDEALRVVEKTMEEYWNLHKQRPASSGTGDTMTTNPDGDSTVESEYDRHRRMLVQQAIYEHNAGWAAELRRYLKDMPEDVTKDTDIVQWWSVSLFSIFTILFF